MPKVKLLTAVLLPKPGAKGENVQHEAGSTPEVDADRAKSLIERGLAEKA